MGKTQKISLPKWLEMLHILIWVAIIWINVYYKFIENT